MSATNLSNVEDLISQLTLEEKISLLAGQGRCRTTGVERLDIPALDTSDGPHGLRGYTFFNPNPGCLLPCGTAMGATFDVDLMRQVGHLLAGEALCRKISVVLAPVVCLQRSPLLGRGFEAFGEDPIMSGSMGGSYINGLQDKGIASCIKHYCSHDQTFMSTEDNCIMSERTLREMQLLPFQVAIKESQPWAVMSSYNRVNGVHVSEDPKLLNKVLREEWGWDGLVLSDWWGTYSTSESVNAGMDLEMPGPTQWRGELLSKAVESRKVSMPTIDAAVRNVLNLVHKVTPALIKAEYDLLANDTEENRNFIRKVAADSLVLLKNDRSILPLKPDSNKTYGLIGENIKNAGLCGGGSSEVKPYYTIQPYDAFVEEVGEDHIAFEVGCYAHNWTPVLQDELTMPGTETQGVTVEFFEENPETTPDAKVIYKATTDKTFGVFADCLPQPFPNRYYTKIRTIFTAPKTTKWRFGLSVAGKAKLSMDGKTLIDQWDDHPKKSKTDLTPCFNGLSMERHADLDLEKGDKFELEILLTNVGLGPVTGIAPAAAFRLGGCEVIDEDASIAAAVELAKKVDVPIVMTGSSSDWEMENGERVTLSLPGRSDELIERVLEANPNAVIITQGGMPVLMPWAEKALTVIHAWLGGQETGHAITDVLFGRVNPSARLSLTFPKRLQDNPAYLTFGKADRELVYGEGVFVGYRYYEQLGVEPEFYFGRGLSYTEFEYSNLVVPDEFSPSADHRMSISVDVQNTGKVKGAEVVQIYVADPDSTLQRPKKELKAFKKLTLEAGEKQTVTLDLDKYALSYWSHDYAQWVAEAGEFTVIVAKSANPKDEVLKAGFNLPRKFYWSGL